MRQLGHRKLTCFSPKRYSASSVLEDDVPFATGRELIVNVPIDPRGYADVYIDDTTGLTVDLPGTKNADRLEAAIPLAIEVAARPRDNLMNLFLERKWSPRTS